MLKRQRVLAIPLSVPCRRSSGSQPGWDDRSWGFHSDDGLFHHCQVPLSAEAITFGPGDTVGCGLLYPPVSRRSEDTKRALGGLESGHERSFSVSRRILLTVVYFRFRAPAYLGLYILPRVACILSFWAPPVFRMLPFIGHEGHGTRLID